MSTTLIVNADDFGITEGASNAILECHLAGSVTSTTLMSSVDASEYAACLALNNPSLGVGLHFNLTLGRPLLAHSKSLSLVGSNGEFLTRSQLFRRYLLGGLNPDEIRSELKAQYSRLREFGVTPTHIDSHQHVHMAPMIFRIVSEFSGQMNIPLRMPWQWVGQPAGKTIRRRVRDLIFDQSLRYCSAVKPEMTRSNSGFCSIFDLSIGPANITLKSYEQLLKPYREGVVELMVHPAYVDDALLAKTSITEVSDTERALLCRPEFSELVASMGFHLGNYRCLSPTYEPPVE